MAYLQCTTAIFPGCGKYLGQTTAMRTAANTTREEWERVAAAEEGDYPGEGNSAMALNKSNKGESQMPERKHRILYGRDF